MPFPNTSDVNKLQKLQDLVQNFQDQKKSYALRKLGCNLGKAPRTISPVFYKVYKQEKWYVVPSLRGERVLAIDNKILL